MCIYLQLEQTCLHLPPFIFTWKHLIQYKSCFLKNNNKKKMFDWQELKDCKTQMNDLTQQWYQAIRISPTESEEDQNSQSWRQ